MKNQGTRIP